MIKLGNQLLCIDFIVFSIRVQTDVYTHKNATFCSSLSKYGTIMTAYCLEK